MHVNNNMVILQGSYGCCDKNQNICALKSCKICTFLYLTKHYKALTL